MRREKAKFSFILNLLLGVQARKDELLYSHTISQVDTLNSYLTLLALKEATIDSVFLYTMAIASLNQMPLTIF